LNMLNMLRSFRAATLHMAKTLRATRNRYGTDFDSDSDSDSDTTTKFVFLGSVVLSLSFERLRFTASNFSCFEFVSNNKPRSLLITIRGRDLRARTRRLRRCCSTN